jgi:hypothetical protein
VSLGHTSVDKIRGSKIVSFAQYLPRCFIQLFYCFSSAKSPSLRRFRECKQSFHILCSYLHRGKFSSSKRFWLYILLYGYHHWLSVFCPLSDIFKKHSVWETGFLSILRRQYSILGACIASRRKLELWRWLSSRMLLRVVLWKSTDVSEVTTVSFAFVMQTASTSETSVNFYHTTRFDILEDGHLKPYMLVDIPKINGGHTDRSKLILHSFDSPKSPKRHFGN